MSRLELPYQGEADAASSRSKRRRESRPLPGRSPAPRIAALSRPGGRPARREPSPTFRLGNTLLAAGLLLVAAPLMAVVALAIRLTSRGPVIYKQPRIGLDRRNGGRKDLGDRRRSDLGGRPFSIYKFRTMFNRSGPHIRQVWTRPNDRRITPVGRLLRLYRVDELPQLVNVLRGEMNVIGPRPEQPVIFERLRERFERFPERQRVLPGITGLAQVRCGYGGSAADVDLKLMSDLEYVERRSIRLDLWIAIRTIPVVIAKKGAR